MEHSPPPSVVAGAPPSAKLASVTRKANEIEGLLSNPNANLPIIKECFTQYLTRVEALINACTHEHEEWLAPHRQQIADFRRKIEDIIHPRSSNSDNLIDLNPRTTSAIVSAPRAPSSIHSNASATSVRIQIAQQKAKIQASREASIISQRLAEEELRLKEQRK